MRRCFAIIILALALLPQLSAAQATQPAAVSAFDKTALEADSSSNRSTLSTDSTAAPTNGLLDISRLLIGLIIVLGLIFGLKWLAQRYFPAVVASKNNAAVRILSRTPLSAKSQIVLAQVGHRVLVLAEGGASVTTLSTITDADEIALLVGKSAVRSAESSAFAEALGESEKEYAPPAPTEEAMPAPERADEPAPSGETLPSGEISELMEKIRGIARQIGK